MQYSFFILSAIVCVVASQNCGFEGIDSSGGTIVFAKLPETTPVDWLFWTVNSYNITSTAAIESPHNKYMRGLRYSTRYELWAEPIFPTFVQTERSLQVQRDIQLRCNDGTTVAYSLIFPLEDENTEAPLFNQPSYQISVQKSTYAGLAVDANILVNDADLDIANAAVFVHSNNPYLNIVANRIPHPTEFSYKVEFSFSGTFFEVGDHQIVLTANDGTFSSSADLTLTILP